VRYRQISQKKGVMYNLKDQVKSSLSGPSAKKSQRSRRTGGRGVPDRLTLERARCIYEEKLCQDKEGNVFLRVGGYRGRLGGGGRGWVGGGFCAFAKKNVWCQLGVFRGENISTKDSKEEQKEYEQQNALQITGVPFNSGNKHDHQLKKRKDGRVRRREDCKTPNAQQ